MGWISTTWLHFLRQSERKLPPRKILGRIADYPIQWCHLLFRRIFFISKTGKKNLYRISQIWTTRLSRSAVCKKRIKHFSLNKYWGKRKRCLQLNSFTLWQYADSVSQQEVFVSSRKMLQQLFFRTQMFCCSSGSELLMVYFRRRKLRILIGREMLMHWGEHWRWMARDFERFL